MFITKLKCQLEYISDNKVKVYSLKKPLIYQSDKYYFIVPMGFKTDFASVPKSLQRFYEPMGKWSKPSVLHDFLYSDEIRSVSRLKADKCFLEAMKREGVKFHTRWIFFLGVRCFGGFYKRGFSFNNLTQKVKSWL